MLLAKIDSSYLPHQAFFCDCCDFAVVKSDDEATGHFYDIFGHEWRWTQNPGLSEKSSGRKIGKYKQFIIALCPKCESQLKQCGCGK